MEKIEFVYKPDFSSLSLSQIEERIGKQIPGNAKVNGMPALHYFVSLSRLDLVDSLLENGANINVCDDDGKTLLHHGAIIRSNSNAILEMALSRGANINAKNRRGETALHLAVTQNVAGRVELLLRYGAHVTLGNNHGETAIDYARKYRKPDIEALMTSYQKASCESYMLNAAIKTDMQQDKGLAF